MKLGNKSNFKKVNKNLFTLEDEKAASGSEQFEKNNNL